MLLSKICQFLAKIRHALQLHMGKTILAFHKWKFIYDFVDFLEAMSFTVVCKQCKSADTDFKHF